MIMNKKKALKHIMNVKLKNYLLNLLLNLIILIYNLNYLSFIKKNN